MELYFLNKSYFLVKSIDFTSALSNILEIESPWFIKEIDTHKGTKTINIFIEFERGTKFICPNCEQLCKVHDSS